MRVSQKGFSLIEILIGIVIVSSIMVAAFQALSSVGIAKVKLIEQTEIEKQAYFSSERLFELVKKGGTIDYEEYWNRYSYGTGFTNGHFTIKSGFGNYGSAGDIGSFTYNDSLYYCLSPNGSSMGTGGCLRSNNTIGLNSSRPQLFAQYEQQFIDRNSDRDNDGGDEDGVNGVIGDDDDLFLGIGPTAFSGSTDANKVGELYLISNDGKERTYFRWRVETATGVFVPSGAICNYSNPEKPVGEACQGTIEMLKLVGVDYGYNHTLVGPPDVDGSQGDGIIDTWFIHPDFTGGVSNIVAGSDLYNYWQPIFPSSINIKDFEIYAYPNKNLALSWRDDNAKILVAPYIRVKYTIEPSLKIKAKISGKTPSVDIATTIGLSSLDIK